MSKDLIITKTKVSYSQTRNVKLADEIIPITIEASFESPEVNAENDLYAKAAEFVNEVLDVEEESMQAEAKPIPAKKAKKAKKEPEIEEDDEDEEAEEEETEAEEDDDDEDEDDIVEEKPKKSKKKKAKKEPKPKDKKGKKKKESYDGEDLELDDIKKALKNYAKEHGKDEAKKVIKQVGGVTKMNDIPEERFAQVVLACEEGPDED